MPYRSRFHTGVARTHVAQDHTKHTASRRHPLSDDGGFVNRTMRPESVSHVDRKRSAHDAEDMWKSGVEIGRHHDHWNTLGEAPASHHQLTHHSDRGSA